MEYGWEVLEKAVEASSMHGDVMMSATEAKGLPSTRVRVRLLALLRARLARVNHRPWERCIIIHRTVEQDMFDYV